MTLFVFEKFGARAEAEPVGDGRLRILAGSTALPDRAGVVFRDSDRRAREALIDRGGLRPLDGRDLLVFTRTDIPRTASQAGAIAQASNCSGRTAWRCKKTGRTFGDFVDSGDEPLTQGPPERAGPPPLDIDPEAPVDARRKWTSLRVMREGAAAFRNDLKQVWDGACAVTGCTEAAALDAAHIYPYGGPQTNDARNGLLLRADIHRLFDRFQLTLVQGVAGLEARIGANVRDTQYRGLDRARVRAPVDPDRGPDLRLLAAHARRVDYAAEARVPTDFPKLG